MKEFYDTSSFSPQNAGSDLTDIKIESGDSFVNEVSTADYRRKSSSQNNSNNCFQSSINSQSNFADQSRDSEHGSFENDLRSSSTENEKSNINNAKSRNSLSNLSSKELCTRSENTSQFNQNNFRQKNESSNNRLNLNNPNKSSLMHSNNFNSELLTNNKFVGSFREFSKLVKTNGYSIGDLNQNGMLLND